MKHRAIVFAVTSLAVWTFVLVARIITGVVDVNHWLQWVGTLVVSFGSSATFGYSVARILDARHHDRQEDDTDG